MKEIGLGVQDLSSLLDDMECMFLLYSAFPVEMVLEKGDVRLALLCFGKELVVCRNVHSRGLDLQSHSHRAWQRWAPLVRKITGI